MPFAATLGPVGIDNRQGPGKTGGAVTRLTYVIYCCSLGMSATAQLTLKEPSGGNGY